MLMLVTDSLADADIDGYRCFYLTGFEQTFPE